MQDKLYIACLGESGFPFQGRAAIEKLKLICKCYVEAGDEVHVVNRKGVFSPNESAPGPSQGQYEGIHYTYAAGTLIRPSNPIQRNLLKLKGSWGELVYLRKMSMARKLDFVFVSTMRFTALLYYYFVSRLLGIKLLYSLVELNTAMQSRTKFSQRLNDRLLKRWEFSLVDAVLPISELLCQEIEQRAPQIPYLKVPILCHFSAFQITPDPQALPYFLYCGSLDYGEVLAFILQAYKRLPDTHSYALHLIVHGKPAQFEALKYELRQHPKKDLISIFTAIPFEELINRYVNAKGLLIPLRPTVQDAARFPHKMGEYLASGNPVITTDYGEVRHYFEDGLTALVAESYEVEAFAEKMRWVVKYPEKAEELGLRGQQMGRKYFDYSTYAHRLHDFGLHFMGMMDRHLATEHE